MEQPRFPTTREVQIADDLNAALTRLDAALASARITGTEHRLRIDAIGSYMKQRGVRGRGTLYDAWTTRRR